MDKSFITDHTDEQVLKIIRQIRDEWRAMKVIPAAAREIAERAGCHINTVQNSVRRLEQKGQLRIIAEKGKPTRYEIL
jgi:DNA-binding transcriptional regulator YhcF (GntR family)